MFTSFYFYVYSTLDTYREKVDNEYRLKHEEYMSSLIRTTIEIGIQTNEYTILTNICLQSHI